MFLTSLLLSAAASNVAAVDLNTGVVSGRLAAAEIGRALSEKVSVAPEFADEVVFLRFSQASPERLLSHFASLLGGEWKVEADGRTLVKSGAIDSRQRAEEIGRRAQFLKEKIAKMRSPGQAEPWSKVDREALLNSKPPSVRTTEDYIAYVVRSNRTPAGRAIMRILDRIDLKKVAAIPPGEGRDVGNGPGRIPVGGNVDGILRQWNQEEQEFRAALASMDKARRDEFLSDGLGLSYERSGKPVEVAGAYMRIVHAEGNTWRFGLTAVDSMGRETLSRSFSIETYPDQAPLPNLPEGAWRQAPFVPAPATLAALQSMRHSNPSEGKPAFIEDITQVDPIRFFVEPWIEKAWPQGDIAAHFSDQAIGAFDLALGATTVLPVAQRALYEHRLERQDGVLTIQPEYPLAARETRIDRAVMQRFVSAARQQLRATLDLTSNYVAGQRPGAEMTPFERLALLHMGIDPYRNESMYGLDASSMGYREFFKFYAARAPAQMEALVRGEKVAFAALPPAQKAAIEKLVYARYRTLEPDRGVRRTPEDPMPLHEFPTYALPNGIPGDALVSLQKRSSLALFETVGSAIRRGWDASSLGYIYFQQADKGEWLNGDGGYVQVDQAKFRPGKLENYHFVVTFPGVGQSSMYLRDEWVDPKGAIVDYKNFPPEHRAEFEKTLANYRRNNQGAPGEAPRKPVRPPR